MSEEPSEMQLVMPFLCVTSHGGPYDDTAFSAGYHCGLIDARLRTIAASEGSVLTLTVQTKLLEQLDLVAMRHGFELESQTNEQWPDWTTATFHSR